MTTEQFLSHLGIEVGKPFIWDEYTMKCEDGKLYKLLDGEWYKSILDIGDLLDEEITPLPKYTLSEDEKAIVRNVFDDMDVIGVDANGSLYVRNKFAIPTWLPFYNVFRFIKLDTEISLDELRKCL